MKTMLTPFLQLAGLVKKWPTFTAEEIEKHHTRSSLWIVAGDSVYDITKLLGDHPGGDSALLRRGGGAKDCSEDFFFHSRATQKDAEKYMIGNVDPKTKLDFAAIARRRAAEAGSASSTSCLNSRKDRHAHTGRDEESLCQTLFPGAPVTLTASDLRGESAPSCSSQPDRNSPKDFILGILGGPNHESGLAATAAMVQSKREVPHSFAPRAADHCTRTNEVRSNSLLLTSSPD